MTERYDLVVIGSGSAGSGVAERCAGAGWRVAVADHRPLGGTCPQRGCIPKKVLVHAADVAAATLRLDGLGLAGGPSRLDWPALQAFKRRFTDPVPQRTADKLTERGIDVLPGHARFVGADRVDVEGRTVSSRHIVIATGAAPARVPIDGFDRLSTSDDFLALDAMPDRVAFVGGGYIAFELAHVAHRAGAEVTILQQDSDPLAAFESDLVARLTAGYRDAGIDVRLDHAVAAVAPEGGGVVVSGDGPDGRFRLAADMAVHGAGRTPAFDDLGLDAGEIATQDGRLCLDACLRSVSNPRVLAAGDAAQRGPALTPVAGIDAAAVATTLLTGKGVETDYTGVPSTVFSDPPLAMVGLTEAQAAENGLRFEAVWKEREDWFSTRHRGGGPAASKVLIDTSDGRILGAHILGYGAEEIINLFALALRQRIPAETLGKLPYVFPTAASDIPAMLG